MARRASSSPHPLRAVLTVAAIVLLAGAGYMIYGKVSDPYRTMSPLPVQEYLENANSLRGNVYKLEAKVAQALEFSSRAGRLFSVENDSGDMVAVLVPVELNDLNIERGQRFVFKISVGEKGILRVQEARKT
jgi:hypothetical protein